MTYRDKMLTKLKSYEQKIKNLENKEKLSFWEKRFIKTLANKSKKQIKLLQDSDIQSSKMKKLVMEQIIDLTDIFEIRDDEGKLVTEAKLRKYSLNTNLELFEEAIKELEKII